MHRKHRWLIALGLLAIAAGSYAAETITYRYDTRGRLTRVERSGTVNNGIKACYTLDRADNRSAIEVVTAGDCAAPPSPPSFSVSDASVSEGQILVFTITRTGSTAGTFSVNAATADGTAANNVHYYSTTGTVTFAPSETSKTFNVNTIHDGVGSQTEFVMYLNLTGATGGASITDAQGAGTIFNIDYCPTC